MNTSVYSLSASTVRFEDCRIHRAITKVPFHKVAAKVLALIEENRDLGITDDNGSTFLHVAVGHSEKFNRPRALPAIYALCLASIDINAQDGDGETALHKLMRREGVWRIVIALLRCGADATIKNASGQSAEDILGEGADALSDAHVTKHWLSLFSPGLTRVLCLLRECPGNVDRCQQLLRFWCRAKTWKNGQLVDLWMHVEGLPNKVVEILGMHSDTNELALHALACNAKGVSRILKQGRANVNTRDDSYQLEFPHSPRVAQPLIAAAWTTECNAVVEALMEHKPDTSLLYTNTNEDDPRPLFFHVLDGQPVVNSTTIVHRILLDSDLTKRNSLGQSILFEAMKQELPGASLIKSLHQGADLAARDAWGRNVRDFALELECDTYVDCIDDYVFGLIVNKDLDAVQRLVLGGYTHIWELLTRELCTVARLNTRFEEDRLYYEIGKYVKDIPRLQKVIGRLFYRIDNQDLEAVERIVADSDLWKAKDQCGRSILHRTLLLDDAGYTSTVLSHCPELAISEDNMGTTPLHLACLQFGRNHNVVSELVICGASWETYDVKGRKPQDYLEEHLSAHTYIKLRKEIVQLASRIYLHENQFDEKLRKIIKTGDMPKLKILLATMSPHVSFDEYSQWLFECVVHDQPDIAVHLIKCGCNPDVWSKVKTIENDEKRISLQEYVQERGFTALSTYIDKIKEKKSHDEFGQIVLSSYQAMDKFESVA